MDWRRALAVVAHPDDLEYGRGAAVAGWTDDGREITYLVATRGEAGIDTLEPGKCAPLREREQRASAEAVGVTAVEALAHRTYITALTDEDPETYCRTFPAGNARAAAERFGGRPAVAFELLPR